MALLSLSNFATQTFVKMSSRILLLGIIIAFLVIICPFNASAASVLPSDSTGLNLNVTMFDGQHLETYLNDFIADYKRVRGRQTKKQMKHISTAGLLAGIVRVDELMRIDLTNRTQSFLHRFEAASVDEVLEHLLQLELTVARDRKSIEFLCKALDVARNAKSFDELKEEVDEDLVAVITILAF